MFKRVACLFGFHSYKHVAVYHYYDISFGEPGPKSTGVTSVCQLCNKIKKKIEIQFIDGFNCLDWCKVLEHASEISVVDSVWCYICEKLDLKAELYLTSRFDPPNWMHIDGLFTKPWKRI